MVLSCPLPIKEIVSALLPASVSVAPAGTSRSCAVLPLIVSMFAPDAFKVTGPVNEPVIGLGLTVSIDWKIKPK